MGLDFFRQRIDQADELLLLTFLDGHPRNESHHKPVPPVMLIVTVIYCCGPTSSSYHRRPDKINRCDCFFYPEGLIECHKSLDLEGFERNG